MADVVSPHSDSMDTGVLIVGSGPSGLTLAIELARRQIPYLLIDKASQRPTSSRALGTQARTIETFQIMNIPLAELAPAIAPRHFRLAERERTLARVPIPPQPSGAPSLIVMDQADTERVLEARLFELGGQTRRGVELVAFTQSREDVISTLHGPDGEHQVRSRFLVGADGAHSVVRRQAGIDFIGAAYPERFLLADVDLDWDLAHDEGQIWIGDDGLVAAIPLPQPRRFRLIIPLPPEEIAREFTSELDVANRAEELLRDRTRIRLSRLGDPIWASSFRLSRRQAASYRKGRVFLAGDAAHVHSPVGGQGMNMGIQDAFNLGWKLALAVQGLAAPGLLDTYQAERHPVAAGVLRGTHLGTRIVLARNPIVRTLRERLVPALTSTPLVQQQLFSAVSQLGIAYPDSPLSVNTGAQPASRNPLQRGPRGLHPGDRVPDVQLLTQGDRSPLQLFDLVRQGWLLLLLPGDEPSLERMAELEALANQVRHMVGKQVQPYLVLPPGAATDSPLAPVLIDVVGELARLFAADRGQAVLIRPDGYLGYRGRPDQQLELASYLARVYAMKLAR